MSNQTVTVSGRIRYPHLFTPKKWANDSPDKPPQFSLELCIDQNDPQLQQVYAIESQQIQEVLGGMTPDGNNRIVKVDPNNPACAGMVILKSKSSERPPVYIRDPNTGAYSDCIDPNKVKDGDYVAVEVWIHGYSTAGRGVTSKINQVLWLGDGPGPLGSSAKSSPQDAFGAVQLPPGVTPMQAAVNAQNANPAQSYQPANQQPQQQAYQPPAPQQGVYQPPAPHPQTVIQPQQPMQQPQVAPQQGYQPPFQG